MLRSFVARSQPLLSRLRWPAVAAKPRIVTYASSATSAARCNGSAGERAAAAARHLYVVLEETNRFSIYKLPAMDEDTVTDGQAPRCLPRAALRLDTSLVGPLPHFEALGSKIAIYGYVSVIEQIPTHGQFLTLLYDTRTGALGGGRALPDMPFQDEDVWIKDDDYHVAVPVDGGKKLCVLEAQGNMPFYLYQRFSKHYRFEWTWEQGPSPLPRGATGHDISVDSHAVHPDGRTIFASSSFTFSLDTKDDESARHGDWLLPFHGRAYYDGDMDAWVGIRVADGTEGGSIEGRPYLCACDVPAALPDGSTMPEPAWKICKEELTFLEAPTQSRTIVHTGRGKFCLIEIGEGKRAEARVTMFYAKRATNGDIKVTPCGPGRSYLVPNYSTGDLLTAFWI